MSNTNRSTSTLLYLATAIIGCYFTAYPVALKASAVDPSHGETGDIPAVAVYTTPKTGADYLQLARSASDRMFSEVENVICDERVQRFKARGDNQPREVDVVEAKVAVEKGEERYSEILQNHKHRAAMQQIGGAWSEGEYATFLREARRVLESKDFVTQGYVTSLNGVPAILFPYDMDETASSWDFQVRSHDYALSFHGELWISQETGEILRSRRVARKFDVSTGISEVDWTVDFSKVTINGRDITLPVKALYSVKYTRDSSREWNVTAFSNYKRFGSESVIRFAEIGEESSVR